MLEKKNKQTKRIPGVPYTKTVLMSEVTENSSVVTVDAQTSVFVEIPAL